MKKKQFIKPSQFTESYQFIQALFHEPIPWKDKVITMAQKIFINTLLIVGMISIISVISFALLIDTDTSEFSSNHVVLNFKWTSK